MPQPGPQRIPVEPLAVDLSAACRFVLTKTMIYNREFRSRHDLLLHRNQAQRKNRKRAAIDGVDLPLLPINGAHIQGLKKNSKRMVMINHNIDDEFVHKFK